MKPNMAKVASVARPCECIDATQRTTREELKTAPRSESDINYLLRELDNLAEVGLGQFCQPLLEPQLATYTRMIQHP